MRKALILALEHGAEHFSVLSGPEVPVKEQVARFKALSAPDAAHTLISAELWESDRGMTRRKRFKPAAELIRPLAGEPTLEELSGTGLLAVAESEEITLPLRAGRDKIIATIKAVRAERAAATLKAAEEAAANDPGTFDGEDDDEDGEAGPPKISV